MVTVPSRLFQGKSGKQNMGSLQTQILFFLICPLKVSAIMAHVFAMGMEYGDFFFRALGSLSEISMDVPREFTYLMCDCDLISYGWLDYPSKY